MRVSLFILAAFFVGSANAAEVPPIGESGAVAQAPPILYRVGASGITFKTSHADAIKRLGKPTSALLQYQVEYYQGEFWTVWENGKPYSMGIESGHPGALALPEPYGSVRVGDVFEAPFTKDDPDGKEFLRALYRMLEQAGPDYDCIAEGSCAVRRPPIERSIVLRLPRMNLIIDYSKGRKILKRIVLMGEGWPSTLQSRD